MRYILALDQGTTSSRALLFDHAGDPLCARRFPRDVPGEEMDGGVGQLAGQEGVGLAELLGGGEQGAADAVGLERHEAAVALGHPGGRGGVGDTVPVGRVDSAPGS